MAKKEISSRPGLFGTTNHYDSNGKKIGESRPGLFGTTNHYDSKGRKANYKIDKHGRFDIPEKSTYVKIQAQP